REEGAERPGFVAGKERDAGLPAAVEDGEIEAVIFAELARDQGAGLRAGVEQRGYAECAEAVVAQHVHGLRAEGGEVEVAVIVDVRGEEGFLRLAGGEGDHGIEGAVTVAEEEADVFL